MNIFYLDEDPVKSAQYHNNSHCVKMVTEVSQMLSTAHRILDGELYYREGKNRRRIKDYFLNDNRNNVLYKSTHHNHPSCLWCRESSSNYKYAYQLFVALCDEYRYRYDKIHATDMKLREVLKQLPKNIPVGVQTEIPLAMEDKYKIGKNVEAYRNYYRKGKSHLAEWKKRGKPYWY